MQEVPIAPESLSRPAQADQGGQPKPFKRVRVEDPKIVEELSATALPFAAS